MLDTYTYSELNHLFTMQFRKRKMYGFSSWVRKYSVEWEDMWAWRH